ncbi:MAG TPA: DUF6273 domain-containing protein [Bacilli bacterium]|nr:DUF6273 domain-containing protein [Bacilli bacterium]
MERKKLFSNIFLSIISVTIFALATTTKNETSYQNAAGGDTEYTLEFSYYQNRLASGSYNVNGYSGTSNAITNLGNPVAFNYGGLRNPTTMMWQSINTNGYITNTAPLNGMTTIIINKYSSSASFGIYWSHDTSFSESRYQAFTSASPTTVVFNFNNYLPNYIRIKALALSEISNIAIFYSCQNSYRTLTVGDNQAYVGFVTGGGTFLIGQSVTITATPYQGNTFSGWYDGDTLVSMDNPYTFAMPEVDTHYTALFTRNYYELTLASSDESKGYVEGAGSYAYGTYVTVTATELTGYQFIGWYQGETLKSTDASYQFMMPYNDLSLTAQFVTRYDLYIYSKNSSLGTVSGSGSFGEGTSVTITATPNEGMYFRAWQDGDENVISRNATYTFTMPSADLAYYAVFSETLPLEPGDIYEFGTYPQSKVTDSALLTSLSSAAGTLPSSSNPQAWTDYGYYQYEQVTSFMWYIDIDYNLDTYRGVYFSSYRPIETSDGADRTTSIQDENGYLKEATYWFKYEPLAWRVLDVVNEQALLMSNVIIDSQDFHQTSSSTVIGEDSYYSNNYEYSRIRAWLADSFYNLAFTSAEKSLITTTLVNNGLSSTLNSYNDYLCADTSDKIFLLSSGEATSATYGLDSEASRQLAVSEYAKVNGNDFYQGKGSWLLRTPYYLSPFSYIVYDVSFTGTVGMSNVYETNSGIVPALWFQL